MSAAAARPEAPATPQAHPVLLAARGLRKEFGGFVAVNNVDLDVRHARVHALIGPNGAGKTTVFNLLTKFLQPTAGSIHLLDQDITRTDPAEREAILAEVEAAAASTGGLGRAVRFRIDRLELVDRQLLHERHLVSRELAAPETGSRVRPGAGLLVQDRASVMVNEEDHLRLQALRSGFALGCPPRDGGLGSVVR